MNRETKRAMARQQKTAGRRSRLRGLTSFGGEVTAELRKVNWPDRRTVFGYTVVVLVSVTVITVVIFGMDTLFGKAVLAVFG